MEKRKKKKYLQTRILVTILLIAVFLLVLGVLRGYFGISADTTGPSKIVVTGGSSLTTLNSFLNRFINVFLVEFMGIGLFISLIIGGFTYLTAGDNAQKVETGKRIIKYALIGVVLTVLAFSLFAIAINIINDIFGK